ncbi:MAG: type I 3-dehydroquinate dehydratase [Spirochaetaceae bacterium]|jgi:3-dehydroquinate dehydratase/shikimate dehydrogenase|nr:type I 3-dehydroquinate dehydratase [Spirochaetaceae bacterium]
MAAKICLCLTGRTLRQNLQVLEKYRGYVDIAELRVDCLDMAERLVIRPFPEQANIPVILTIRRKEDGGNWGEGESARIVLLAKALAFAQTDKRCNFAYVDLEEDVSVPGIEEAARAFGTRIIRSFHNVRGTDADLTAKIRNLRRVGDEIAKVSVMPNDLRDVLRLWQAAKDLQNIEKILISMGPLGTCTRILANRIGSYLTFTSVKDEAGFPLAAPGQIDPKELVERYRFRSIDDSTDILGITGYPLTTTDSPRLHNEMYARDSVNAVYLPFPAPVAEASAVEDFLALANEIGLRGASVTIPFKEKILPHLAFADPETARIGACNTIVRHAEGWRGYNTDAEGFSSSLLAFIYGTEVGISEKQQAKRTLRGKKVTVIGAGGAARAIVAEVYRLNGKALILNRTGPAAKKLASRYNFRWGVLDESGAKDMAKCNDIIIQTTSAGMGNDTDGDPFPLYLFTGREIVYDIIYKPERTHFLRRAEKAGCKTMNGYDMLVRQAIGQHRLFFDLPKQTE